MNPYDYSEDALLELQIRILRADIESHQHANYPNGREWHENMCLKLSNLLLKKIGSLL